ncbi:NAD-dependent epimerase/dehydratase family protein [Candidatus Uhrbacteria bacterium]|nr:NAD-dependent epimerase/dehydratase family protein [Candidatus Uhrbacteria bacterium]
MRILILGGDGYLGWPTAMHFSRLGHEVAVVDNMIKRAWEAQVGVAPLYPIPLLPARMATWKTVARGDIKLYVGDIAEDVRFIYRVMEEFRPDAIVHYAEQPSAPYSMRSRHNAVLTQKNNVIGTLNVLFAMRHSLPDAHLVKLGTMGEYGTPNIDIEEGHIEINHKGRSDRLPFPKQPGSFYHLSKVHDSHNIEFACRVWGLKATDLNQGVVYGLETEEINLHDDLRTSFHYDDVFGTALNRFCVQAVAGMPLTVYGKGGQKRGFLNIRDTLQCVELAVLNPGAPGEFRVFNQFTEVFSIMELAETVARAAAKLGIDVKIEHLENPRIEKEEHYYNPKNDKLLGLGLVPTKLSEELVNSMLVKIKNAERLIDKSVILPKIKWRQN